jgi:hypothetical protein
MRSRASADGRPVPPAGDVELLWAAASPYPNLERVSAIAPKADVARVIDTAIEQRVGPLVLRSLRRAGVGLGDLGIDTADEPVWRAHAQLALPAAAAAALGPLDAAGLAPLVLKGLALAERYPALGLRPMDDIDLLVRRDLMPPARRILERAGWQLSQHLGPERGYDVPLFHPDVPGIPLELHYDFAEWRERSRGLSRRRLWEARRPALVFGHEAYVLPPEMEIVAYMAHAAKGFHCFSRLMWIADVAVISSTAQVDWDGVARYAAESRRRVSTAIGLTMARRLGADVPEELTMVPSAIARTNAVQALLDPAHPFLVTGGPSWSVPYALTDDLSGMLRRAVGDVRIGWAVERWRGVREVLTFFVRGLPRLVRSRAGRQTAGA